MLGIPLGEVAVAAAAHAGVEAWQAGRAFGEQVCLAQGGALVRDVLQHGTMSRSQTGAARSAPSRRTCRNQDYQGAADGTG
jgi:hypothetical protein